MGRAKVTISGLGCALADYLYTGISFHSAAFQNSLSRKTGDGGLSPGKLVFTEELEKFAGKPYPEILNELTGGKPADSFNIGGPGLVSMIHVSQLLNNIGINVRFYGITGKDETACRIFSLLERTPLDISYYRTESMKPTPHTDVLSDPGYDNGHGERTFINNIGAAWDFLPDIIDESFFGSDIVCFGGTALVPRIHDILTELLHKAKKRRCITVVNTVYDFRNEKEHPWHPWPLVDKDGFNLIDLLIMDREEALKISGESSMDGAARFFKESGVSSFVITNGAEPFVAYSDGRVFNRMGLSMWPVSEKVATYTNRPGDTTGCGDNFTGGLIASLAEQLSGKNTGQVDMYEALSWAVASGGFTCFYIGGTYYETSPGEKRRQIEEYRQTWLKQTGIKTGGHA